MNTKSRKYVAPKLEVLLIELEQGIATGSSNIIFNGPNDPAFPEVEGWKDGETFEGDLEI